jgi:nucleotide-binding universal stress UspA family protein
MRPIHRIVFPVDFSERSKQAAKYARALAWRFHADLALLHALAENASLIILPTHGYGPFRRFLLGSATAKVLRDADCPVLIGAHMEHAP